MSVSEEEPRKPDHGDQHTPSEFYVVKIPQIEGGSFLVVCQKVLVVDARESKSDVPLDLITGSLDFAYQASSLKTVGSGPLDNSFQSGKIKITGNNNTTIVGSVSSNGTETT